MRVVIIYESLTGNTRKASHLIAEELVAAGHDAVACPTTLVDYQALHDADLVVIGGWTDGLFFIGQKPGRAGRLRGLPALRGKRAVCFVTYAIDPGKTLEKLSAIVEGLGASVEGGMTIRRDKIDSGARDFAARLDANVLAYARAAALVGLVLAGCAAGSDPTVGGDVAVTTAVAPTTTTVVAASTTTTATTTTAPVWVVGATPLPLRPDGYGEILPTPAVLVDRRLPTTDVLPPPANGGFESSIAPIDDVVRARMGGTHQDGCPVAIDDLLYVTVSFRGFDGGVHAGELVVHEDVAADVVSVFEQLFGAGFPLEEMRLITDADLAAPPTGDGNNTAAFVCRAVRGGTRFSAHASGLAIDVNPFNNPYQRDDVVLPELASAYLDRTAVRPGMILDGDVVVEAFEAIGWTWGGRWDDPVDTMHFSATGG